MSNTFFTSTFVAKKALSILRNKIIFAKLARRDYEELFTSQNFAPGQTINIRRPVNFIAQNGPSASPQPIIERIAPLTITDQPEIIFEFSSEELTLLIEKPGSRSAENLKKADLIIERYVEPAVIKLVQDIERRIYNYSVLNSNYFVGTPGTLINNPGTINIARGAMNKLGMPMDNRFTVVSHDTEVSIQNSMQNFFDLKYTDPILREGYMGYLAGAEFAASSFVTPHTSGTGGGGSPVGGFIASGTIVGPISSGSTITITGLPASTAGTFLQGDAIYVVGSNSVNQGTSLSAGINAQFVVTANAPTTSPGGQVTIPIAIAGQPIISDPTNPYQNITPALPNGAAVFLAATHTPNIMMHRDALVVCMPPLARLDPASVETVVVTDKESGLSLRYSHGADISGDLNIQRFDALLGVAFFADYAMRICG